jgi:hypothetical protein
MISFPNDSLLLSYAFLRTRNPTPKHYRTSDNHVAYQNDTDKENSIDMSSRRQSPAHSHTTTLTTKLIRIHETQDTFPKAACPGMLNMKKERKKLPLIQIVEVYLIRPRPVIYLSSHGMARRTVSGVVDLDRHIRQAREDTMQMGINLQ